jgi:tricorn protease
VNVFCRFIVPCLLVGLLAANLPAREAIRLANDPALSPDGSTLAFSWRGEIWTVPVSGGIAKQLTRNAAADGEPEFSPDGSQIAFISERSGSEQVYVMPVEGGPPEQLTFHTSGYKLHGWYPDGKSLLTSGERDHFWRGAERFFRIERGQRVAEQILFDDYGTSGALSPDGKRLLFTREGPAWWRKGYHGSQAAQIWMHDLEPKTFTRLLDHDRGCLWPMWRPDGKAFYYVGGQNGTFNLYEHSLENGNGDRQITRLEDDGVVFPCIARNGSVIVYRQLFDLYRINPASAEPPAKIEIFDAGDTTIDRVARRRVTATCGSWTRSCASPSESPTPRKKSATRCSRPTAKPSGS